MNKESNIIFETTVKYNKKTTFINLTENKIRLKQFKGIINKELKVIEEILLDDIKTVGGKIQIDTKLETLVLKTILKEYKFICADSKIALELKEEIINTKTGTNKFERTASKIQSILTTSLGVIAAVGGIAATTKKIIEKVKKIKG